MSTVSPHDPHLSRKGEGARRSALCHKGRLKRHRPVAAADTDTSAFYLARQLAQQAARMARGARQTPGCAGCTRTCLRHVRTQLLPAGRGSMQLTQPVCRHPVSSATKHTRARPRLRRAAAAPSWRAHSGPWRAGTRQPAPSALRPDAQRAAGHTARQRKSSTHMYVGFSVLAAGAKLPSISAPQLPAAGRQEEGWTRSLGRPWCSFCAKNRLTQRWHPA